MKRDEEEMKIEIIKGKGEVALYLNDIRVAGPKPWGGGKLLYAFECNPYLIREVLIEKEQDFRERLVHKIKAYKGICKDDKELEKLLEEAKGFDL